MSVQLMYSPGGVPSRPGPGVGAGVSANEGLGVGSGHDGAADGAAVFKSVGAGVAVGAVVHVVSPHLRRSRYSCTCVYVQAFGRAGGQVFVRMYSGQTGGRGGAGRGGAGHALGARQLNAVCDDQLTV